MTVTTIPLQHRIPCCGFLFAEKARPNHIIRDMVDFYKVPVYELNRIKNGSDYVTPEGEVIANTRLTRPSDPPRKYAYCSDTIFIPEIVEQLSGVDLLFHEATFAESELARAKETYHTTAAQAARIALEARGTPVGNRSLFCPLRRREYFAERSFGGIPEYDSGKRKFVYKSLIPGK